MEYSNRIKNQSFLNTIKKLSQPNKIILTQKGLQKLGSMGEWGQSQEEPDKETVCSRFLKQRLQNSISFDRFANNRTVNQNKKYSMIHTEQNTDKFSKKTIKKYQLWENEQKHCTKKLKRQLERNINQKYKAYEWPQVTDYYKAGIKSILKNWQVLNSSQNSRTKQRLLVIHHQKYSSIGIHESENHLNNNKQRSFLVPRSSKINYGQIKQKKKQNTEPKVFYKMTKTTKQFHPI